MRDLDFYNKIWRERAHYCFETGEYIGSQPSTAYFHHVLPKAKYPEYRYEEWNIVLVSLLTHNQEDMNPRKNPKIREYEKQLLNKVNQ